LKSTFNKAIGILCVGCLLIHAAGCSPNSATDESKVEKPPKPVSTMILRHGSPSFQSHTTAAVTPWKVERIGFEQAGRVVQVIEPNEMVKANSDRQPGTPLARLAEEKLLIAVEAAKADMAVAERQLDTSRVAIEQSFPAGIKTAESEYGIRYHSNSRIDCQTPN